MVPYCYYLENCLCVTLLEFCYPEHIIISQGKMFFIFAEYYYIDVFVLYFIESIITSIANTPH